MGESYPGVNLVDVPDTALRQLLQDFHATVELPDARLDYPAGKTFMEKNLDIKLTVFSRVKAAAAKRAIRYRPNFFLGMLGNDGGYLIQLFDDAELGPRRAVVA